ncbi:major facilitator superfamily domain-containing protein [Chaetomidium leptoderma]|uniref:Major facilitator superfamily domain-containing protein n=1 Tax=Chaetomidium leptoderma TaxID=669021 RepID=A0AAN6ZVU3_9PEZI|nr:major facilitator superfamily domain-containing protein [Chaetomidium leptoderma]
MEIPPQPPAKELPALPAPSTRLRIDPLGPIASPSQPPNRPLPPRPTAKSLGSPEIPQPSRPPPLKFRIQAPLGMNPPTRPGTAASQTSKPTPQLRFPGSTKRFSWASMASKRPIKYAQGKYGRVELVPQPSDDPDDPLTWPVWRKELNFWSLLMMVAMTGVMKTIFMTVNAQLAESYNVSYTAVAALTGVPLILSALTGFVCLMASRICGKRPLYLTSLLLVFIGAVLNTNVASGYAQSMAARVFQGLGWGAFDTLVLGSIQDTYYEHERGFRIAIHSIVAVTTTWGPPLIGGVASQGQAGTSLQFMILSAFFVVAVPAIALGAPETSFDRTFIAVQTPATAASQYKTSLPPIPRRLFSLETLTDYVVKLRPYAYSGPADLTILLQAPRALITPTTALLAIVSLLPYSSLWGLTTSLSLLFHPLPFILSPGTIGALFLAPFLLSAAAVATPAFSPRWQTNNFSPKLHMAAIAAGSALAFIGILTFGLHLDSAMTPPPPPPNNDQTPTQQQTTTSVFAFQFLAPRVSLAALSFVLGLLAAGAALLDATAAPVISASTAFTGSNLAVSTRNTADMVASLACWRALAAGLFVLAVPNAVWWWGGGLRGFCIGVAIAQGVVAALVATVWWLFGEGIRRWDGRVMGLVDLEGLKRSGSFFDLD